MKGYKVFNSDWTCRGFQYKVGETYEMDGKPHCCESGFHFCERLMDCFKYYDFDSNNKVAEIESLGDIDFTDNKCCTNKIKIVEELSWEKVLTLVNTGYYNTGNCNTGGYNTGDCNTGYYNTGCGNTGDCNTGCDNTGDYNTGCDNTGDCNTGCGNTGDFNTGYYNTGDFNTGDFNKISYSTGCFNTQEKTILMFNKPSSWTIADWKKSKARNILNKIPTNKLECVTLANMSNEEKELYPSCETTGGYLKEIKVTVEDKQNWWNDLSESDRKEVLSLPNFDKNIFKEITGINVEIGC